MNSLISIIIPVYNCERSLRRCVDSVINQQYKNLEIILIDDGSADSSKIICDEYAKRDRRIKVIHKNNEGVSAARNIGLNLAKGDYIAFIDSDDYVFEDYIVNLLDAALTNNADISCCNYNEVNDSDVEKILIQDINMEEICSNPHNIAKFSIIYGEEGLIRAYLEHKSFAYLVWGKLFKGEFIRKYRFSNLKYTEDTNFMVKISEGAPTIVLVPYCGYLYLKNNTSLTAINKLLPRIIATLKTADYVFARCKKKYPNLIELAKIKLLDYIFSALSLLSYETINEQYFSTMKEINFYLNKIKNHEINIGIFRSFVLKISRKHYRPTKCIFKIYHFFRGKTI